MKKILSSSKSEKGSVLLEALISIVLFSIGILAIIGLQAAMVRHTTESRMRAEAAYEVSKLFGRMWVDIPNLSSYSTSQAAGLSWVQSLNTTFPNISGTVTVNGSAVDVSLGWQTPNGEPHRYTASTLISTAN